MSAYPILYSFRRCPYAMRARLALAVSDRICELREVVLADKPPEMRAVSPKATVPVAIDLDGRVLDESIDIMLWALAKNDPNQWLNPEKGSLQTMLEAISRFDNGFKYHLDRYKYPNRYENTDSTFHRGEASVYLQQLNAQLNETMYLFGDRISLADMAIFPFIRQFSAVERDWFELQQWQYLQSWLTELTASNLFTRIMHKYQKWEPNHQIVLFPPTSPQ